MTDIDQIRALTAIGAGQAECEARIGHKFNAEERDAFLKARSERREAKAKADAERRAERKRRAEERAAELIRKAAEEQRLGNLFSAAGAAAADAVEFPDEARIQGPAPRNEEDVDPVASWLADTTPLQPTLPRQPMTALERQHKHRAKGREIGELPLVGEPFLRWACERNLLLFGLKYFSHSANGLNAMLKRPPSERMKRFVRNLEHVILHGGQKHVRWPRGKGKTTWIKIAAIWALLYGHRRFVVIVAKTKAMAKASVDEIWLRVQTDPLIMRDFPEFAVPLRDVALTPQRSRVQTYMGERTRIVQDTIFGYYQFPTMANRHNTGGIICWRGADQALRGLNILSDRPDLIVIDDPQTDIDAKNPETVSKIEDNILGGVLGSGENDSSTAAVMASTPIEPDDVSERFADPDRHPEWFTETEQFVVSWGPDDLKNKYLALMKIDEARGDKTYAGANQFYMEHQAEIEAGVEMMDPGDFDPDTEISAYQHALNRLKVLKQKRFDSEMQMKPTRSQGVFRLDATKVAANVNGYAYGTIPAECRRGIVAFCDVNAVAGLRWGIYAFGDGRRVARLAYGSYPANGQRLFPEGTPESAVPSFLAPAIHLVAAKISSTVFKHVDGTPETVKGICFDGGWETATVSASCEAASRTTGVPVVWSKGFPAVNYRPTRARPEMRGEYCHIGETENGPFLAICADYWKELSQSLNMNPPLQPSSISFYGTDKSEHYAFALEVVADKLKAKWEDPKTTLTRWEWEQPGGNHFGDVDYGALAYASIRGIFDAAKDIVEAVQSGLEFKGTKMLKAQRRRNYVYKG